MKKSKGLSNILVLFIGIIVGIATIITIVIVLSQIYPLSQLSEGYHTFGDIKIRVQDRPVTEEYKVLRSLLPEGSECNKELWMIKDNVPFLLITQDKNGKVNGLFLCKTHYRPVFWMEPLRSPGEWGNAMYSGVILGGKPVGDAFKDIDFDGCFDFKLACSSDGNIISRFIFVDGTWQKIDHYNGNELEARIGEALYIFDPNTGSWQLVQ